MDWKDPLDLPDLYTNWSADRKRMRRNAEPLGSPLEVVRTKGKMFRQTHHRQAQQDIFLGRNTSGNLGLQQRDEMQVHANGVTNAIRQSLSTANDELEVMIKAHQDQVASLQNQLAVEQQNNQWLYQEITRRDAQPTADQQQVLSLRNELASEQRKSSDLQTKLTHQEQMHQQETAANRTLRVEKRQVEQSLAREQHETKKVKEELKESRRQAKELSRDLKKPRQIFIILQDHQQIEFLRYEEDVSFGKVLERFAHETNQNAARLTGRWFVENEAIKNEEVFPAE